MSRWTNKSPGDLSIELPEVSSDPVAPAVEAAKAAAVKWARTPFSERVSRLKTAQSVVEHHKEKLAEGIALETGKPLREAVGEVGAVVAKFDLTIADAQRYLAEETPENLHPAIVRRRSRGPAAVIGPFNFPIHLPHGQILSHLIAGNPVVFKPSPLAANVCANYGRLMSDVLPAGVFNVVQGGGEEGKELCLHPAIRSVAFTGSVPVGRELAKMLAGDLSKDVALELGGKNAAIVCADADLQKAADAVADAACLTAGQRCNSTSRVIVERRVSGDFFDALRASLAKFVPGDPMDEKTMLGPLISQAASDRYVLGGISVPHDWIVPGGLAGTSVLGKIGYYVRPAVARLSPEDAKWSPVFNQEIFAPVLAAVEFDDEEHALILHDQTQFGLTTSIFTKSKERFNRLANRLNVGNVYANLPTTFSPSTLPFGGLGDSGNGRPGGRGFVRFVTDEQVVQMGKDSLV